MNVYIGEPNSYHMLSGNQAIARGCIEAGVTMVTGYPGTPSTEVIKTLMMGAPPEMQVSWQINEKVAFEIALGVSWSGRRAMVTMKQAGLNAALDSVISAAFSPVRGGLVIYVADDPGAHYGMAEQDSRYLALMAHIPVLEPADQAEAKDMVKKAFRISEEIEGLILIRGTTLFTNSSMAVKYDPITKPEPLNAITFDPALYTKAGSDICVTQHKTTLERLKKYREIANGFAVEHNPGSSTNIGIVTIGVPHLYVMEVLKRGGLQIPVLKLGMSHPMPAEKIISFTGEKETVLVFEEIGPPGENGIREVLGKRGISPTVLGRGTGIIPPYGELTPEIVQQAITETVKAKCRYSFISSHTSLQETFQAHKPSFCAGCPHAATYLALKKVLSNFEEKGKTCMVTGDIGCTILGMNEPFRLCWTEISMGASIGIAHGLAKCHQDGIVVACIGDASFFHNGLTALINASYDRVNITVIILDNRYTGMTGHQPNVGSKKKDIRGKKHISMKKLVKAAGVSFVKTVDPYFFTYTRYIIKKAIKYPGVSVVICRRACPQKRNNVIYIPFRVISQRCEECIAQGNLECMVNITCPALKLHNGFPEIDVSLCEGCGTCRIVCPYGAIVRDVHNIQIRKGKANNQNAPE